MRFTLASAINYFCIVLEGMILIRVVISWFGLSRDNVIIQTLYTLTEPILEPIRNLLNKSPLGGPGMMLDFSPIISVFLIEIVKGLLISIVGSI